MGGRRFCNEELITDEGEGGGEILLWGLKNNLEKVVGKSRKRGGGGNEDEVS